jgi:hypothetical protein
VWDSLIYFGVLFAITWVILAGMQSALHTFRVYLQQKCTSLHRLNFFCAPPLVGSNDACSNNIAPLLIFVIKAAVIRETRRHRKYAHDNLNSRDNAAQINSIRADPMFL